MTQALPGAMRVRSPARSHRSSGGGDRTRIDLPTPQQRLLERVTALGKPTVLVLLSGSALSVNWAQQHVPASPDATPADTPGRWLGKLAQMIDVLQEWGYTPELRTSQGGRTAEVTLAHCPFLELARENPAVVCGIHRGLISGSLAQLGENATRVSLEPFVDDTTCLAHVSTTTPFRTTASTTATKEPE